MKTKKMKDEYGKIVKKLNLNVSADVSSSKNLEILLKAINPVNRDLVKKSLAKSLKFPCLIAGGGPSLEEGLRRCIELNLSEKTSIVAVDGTCKLFHEIDFIPDILVTDLDGDWSSIFWAIRNNATTLIHAHGDNHHLIDKFFLEFDEIKLQSNLWGTTQNYFSSELFNFGGFTDGDRAIFLAFYFQAPIIGLLGFDFGKDIGKYSLSHPQIVKDFTKKKLKFEIAISLINEFHQYHTGLRFNLGDGGMEIPGFPRLNVENFVNIINKDNK